MKGDKNGMGNGTYDREESEKHIGWVLGIEDRRCFPFFHPTPDRSHKLRGGEKRKKKCPEIRGEYFLSSRHRVRNCKESKTSSSLRVWVIKCQL